MRDNYWKGPVKAKPDFGNVLKVLAKQKPGRPTLIDLFLNQELHAFAADPDIETRFGGHPQFETLRVASAFRNLGYDYVTVPASDMRFQRESYAYQQTCSLNDGAMIRDEASFEAYRWPVPSEYAYDRLEKRTAQHLPEGMKYIVIGPCGVLENTIALTGFDNLCMLIYDSPDLVQRIVDAIGSRLLEYYRNAVQYDSVGAAWVNDDWGFKTQIMLSPEQMRRYIVPWHKRISEVVHAAGKPTIMHSCGCLDSVLDDIIVTIGHDGKHSYEDVILPVEEAYERLAGKLAVIGGIDMDYLCRATPDAVYQRSKAMLDRSRERGGYALGTGNSVPEYIPRASYLAMLAAALDER